MLLFPVSFSPDGKPSTGIVCGRRGGAGHCSLGMLVLLLPRCLERMMASWDMPRRVQNITGFTREVDGHLREQGPMSSLAHS